MWEGHRRVDLENPAQGAEQPEDEEYACRVVAFDVEEPGQEKGEDLPKEDDIPSKGSE